MTFFEKSEVLRIHAELIAQFGGSPGLRDEGLLDSELAAPANRTHYEQAGLATCAATYAFHLTCNHPFVDGNKRVGVAVAELFVRRNGGTLDATNDEIVALSLAMAAGQLSREDVESHFANWVKPVAS